MKHFILIFIAITTLSCKNTTVTKTETSALKTNLDSSKQTKTSTTLSNDFKTYWYSGEAEITSYQLEQYRYGELRNGKAVLVYVTEPFLKDKQVKADYSSDDNIPVLKLNATKDFLTGIYPYHILQSTFYPVTNTSHALKVSASIQEWCGHVYTQLNNKNEFEITSHSYFENEADKSFKMMPEVLENELWTQLRINPKSLPTGQFKAVPSLEFLRLTHHELKSYNAEATLNSNSYAITYPELNRTLTIQYENQFPCTILGWSETVNNKTSKATRLKTIKSAYWSKNSNKNVHLRDSLLLKN